MSQPFIGEIRLFSGNFAPRGWALCEGQYLPIEDNESLYALLGTTYGGDGRIMFALPDMRGRIPVGDGLGANLTPRYQGERFGVEKVFITSQHLPSHSHNLMASQDVQNNINPGGKVFAHTPAESTETNGNFFKSYDPEDALSDLGDKAVSKTGDGQAHSNLMPALCINYIIALGGNFPSRS